MRTTLRWLVMIAVAANLIASHQVFAAPQCSDVIIKSKNGLKSQTLELYTIVDGKVVKAPGKSTLKRDEIAFPLRLLDCEDGQHYFWQRPEGPVLVKKAKFACVTSGSGSGGPSLGGVPGSGTGNTSCG
ncbi:hypothetical protein GCM10007853_20950 [Algimonas ampicilliniresistens]|jgi:hypothetical protein|uniref:Uncharacterized protein n=1 Tax=Algimonas ampicilliniresistens TaxID=1298735 RepID=A0ABQ5V9J3_9PROT|nr:hypothetical protein [Algimonas ampicilliniresistens]GLQ24221.1 hypothetical protein GCM10007853_20950 [Algimonas ampicilliniresistens]